MIIFSKRNKPFAWLLTSLVAALMGLFQLAAPAAWAGEEAATMAESKSAPCKGLKPYNNLDELLYQFYINLDSDCLFKMPVEKLEVIWNTRIKAEWRVKENNEDDSEEQINSEFYYKPFKSERDAFYIYAYHDKKAKLNGFNIVITREYFEKFGTLFPEGRFPKSLPGPLMKMSANPLLCKAKPEHLRGKDIFNNFIYYWLNTDQTRIIYMNVRCYANEISVSNGVPAFIKEKSTLR